LWNSNNSLLFAIARAEGKWKGFAGDQCSRTTTLECDWIIHLVHTVLVYTHPCCYWCPISLIEGCCKEVARGGRLMLFLFNITKFRIHLEMVHYQATVTTSSQVIFVKQNYFHPKRIKCITTE
jgi:hypothetical protein